MARTKTNPLSPKVRFQPRRAPDSPLLFARLVDRTGSQFKRNSEVAHVCADLKHLAVFADEDDTKEVMGALWQIEDAVRFKPQGFEKMFHDGLEDLQDVCDGLFKRARKHARQAQGQLEAYKTALRRSRRDQMITTARPMPKAEPAESPSLQSARAMQAALADA